MLFVGNNFIPLKCLWGRNPKDLHMKVFSHCPLLKMWKFSLTMGRYEEHSFLSRLWRCIFIMQVPHIWRVWGIASLSLLGSFHNLLVDKRIVLTLSISYPINYEDRWGLMLCLENAPIKGSEAVRMNFLRNGVRENSSYSLAGRFLPPIQPINE